MAKNRSLKLFGGACEYTCTFISECKRLYGDMCPTSVSRMKLFPVWSKMSEKSMKGKII